MSVEIDRRAAAICAFLGLGTLAIFIGFFSLPAVQAALEGGCGKADSLAQFQQARAGADLIHVFSAPGGECRAPMIAAMDSANRLDLFLFIPVYSAFLIAAVIMFAPAWREGLALAAVAAIAIGALGDVLETWTQLRITQDIEGARGLLTSLAAGYWIKYGGLALHAGLLAIIVLTRPRRAWTTGALGLAVVLATVAVAAGAAPPAFMTGLFSLFWLSLLIAAIVALALRTSPAPAPRK